LLRRHGHRDELIAAGLLHDVLEKTSTTRTELQRRFGARIAKLVEAISDNPSIDDYQERKRELRDRVARADSDTRAIFAADKIAKVRELALPPGRRVDGATAGSKLAHYRASLAMLRRVAGELELVDLLDDELSRWLSAGPPDLTAQERSPAPESSGGQRPVCAVSSPEATAVVSRW
jgi:hypothetical protein